MSQVGGFFFALMALVSVLGALVTIAARSPIRSAVGLLVTIGGIAGLFLKLNAQFLAAIQLIVYAGAVVVLFVFVIMLLGPDAGSTGQAPGRARISRYLGGALLAALAVVTMVMLARVSTEPTPLRISRPDHGTVEAVGGLLFSKGIIPFELATALLIVAVIGAIAVARTRPLAKPPPPPAHETKRLFHGPLHPRDAEHPLSKETR